MQRNDPDYESFGLTPVAKNAIVNEPDYESFGLTPVAQKKSSNPILNLANKQWDIETNVAKDLFDVGKKLPGAAIETAGKIPEYLDYLKENIPAAGKLILNNPKAAGKAAIAGVSEEAGKISRIPPAVMDYLAKIGMINPERAKEFARPYTEEETKRAADKFMGEELPGSGLIRGAGRNMDALYGVTKAAGLLNPARFTDKAYISKILKAETGQVAGHSKIYNDVWREANKTGFNQVPINAEKLNKNLEVLEKHKTPKQIETLKEVLKNPTLENAQKAQSQMNRIHRALEEKSTKGGLEPWEKDLYNAAYDSEKHIEQNMFKNAKGQANTKLQNRYNKLTKSYAENVVPYKYNEDIQAYKNKKETLPVTINKLRSGEFAAKKGHLHKEIQQRELFQKLLKGSGYVGGGLAGLAGAHYLINLLRGNSERP